MMSYGPRRHAAYEESCAMDHEYYSSMQMTPPGHHNHMKQHVAFTHHNRYPYQNMQHHQYHHQNGSYSGHASAGGRMSPYHDDHHMMMMNNHGAGPAAADGRMMGMQYESRDDHFGSGMHNGRPKVEWKNL